MERTNLAIPPWLQPTALILAAVLGGLIGYQMGHQKGYGAKTQEIAHHQQLITEFDAFYASHHGPLINVVASDAVFSRYAELQAAFFGKPTTAPYYASHIQITQAYFAGIKAREKYQK